jgi:hypothetical protein
MTGRVRTHQGVLGGLNHIARQALRGPEAVRSYDVATELAVTASRLAQPAARGAGLKCSAKHFETAKRPDLAARCRALAKALAANDPAPTLKCALSAARSLAAEGKWDGVATTIEDAIKAAPEPGTSLLQAPILLEEACLKLGKVTEGQAWLARARALVDRQPLTDGGRKESCCEGGPPPGPGRNWPCLSGERELSPAAGSARATASATGHASSRPILRRRDRPVPSALCAA